MKKSLLCSCVTAVLFATLEPVSKLISNEVNPFAITFWRFLLGTLVLLPFAIPKMRKSQARIEARDVLGMSLLGILFVAVSMVSLQIGVKVSDSPSLIAIIFSSNSVFTILFAILLHKEKMTLTKTAAVVLGVLGVLFCIDPSGTTNWRSVLLALFAAISFSLYTVLARRYCAKFGGMVQSSFAFLSGSIVLLLVLFVLGVDISVPMKADTLAALFYISLPVTGIGYACYFGAMEMGGVIMASMAFFIKPILTPFVTWAVNGIVPDVKIFIAVALIVGASVLATHKKKAAV